MRDFSLRGVPRYSERFCLTADEVMEEFFTVLPTDEVEFSVACIGQAVRICEILPCVFCGHRQPINA